MIRYLLIALLMYSATCEAEDIYVQLKKEVELTHLEVQLGDIAEVISNNPGTVQSITRLPVLQLKSVVVPVKLNKVKIQELLDKKASTIGYSFIWGSEDTVLLTGAKRMIDLSAGADKAASWILENIQSNSGKAVVVPLHKLELNNMPIGQVEQQPIFSEVRQLLNKVSIPLEVFVDGVLVAKPTLSFKVNGNLAMSNHAGKNLTEWQEDSISVKNNLPSASNPVESYMVQKDQKVQVMLDVGLMHIESGGIALSNGNKGDEVIVQRIDNNELFTGVVSAPGVINARGS